MAAFIAWKLMVNNVFSIATSQLMEITTSLNFLIL